ncbi:putative bifunctional diguanylate cyclase/phosphodiesterase [Geodermatophilus sp. FMUSA9-8]|uniref:putative bifunctional diguanylate cyclase/phosphodiesterase n=1 Tax=Geodermatophilus sp. FMUSA9-8 TaxID=3120155 RepID=UPI00300B2E80
MSTISVRPGPTVPPALLRRGAVGAAAVVVALLLGILASWSGTPAGTGLYFALIWLTVGGAWLGVRRGQWRPPAVCIALGVTLSAVGDVLWELQDAGADVGPADAVYLASYVSLGIGLALLARSATHVRDQRLAAWIDAAVVFFAVLLVVWELSIVSTVNDESLDLVSRVVLALYPAMDAALIGLVVRLLAARRQGEWAPLAVAAACACWLFSDLAYLLVADADADSFGSLLDAGWVLGSLLLAIAAQPQTGGPDGSLASRQRSALTRLAVALGALVVPPAVELLRDVTGGAEASGSVFVSMVVLVALLFVRCSFILRGEATARSLLASRERYAAKLTAHSSDAVLVVARDGRLLNDGAPLAALLGTAATPLATSGEAVALAGVDPQLAADLFARALVAEGATVDAEIPVRHRGEDRWISVRLTDLSRDPDVGGVVVHVTDVTGRRRAEDALAHSVLHDGLTGLANRTLFADRVGQALLRTVRGGGSAAVVSVDVDGFKAVNDGLGHAAGDALLREVAARLRAAVRADDTVARIGGDEFAVLVEQTGDDEAVTTATRVREVLAAPMTLSGTPVTVTASVGVAVGRGDVGAESLIGDADLALYAAKLDGRDRMKTFSPCMRAQAREARELEQELRGALDGGQFRLVYQPVVGLGDRRVTGFEALLRWDSPRLGPVGPDRFVPVAEAAGLMDAIGSWVLREACATAATWLRDHPRAGEFSMAVNVSATQLGSPDLVASIAAALAESGLPARCLVLEVTETALVGDPERAAACLAALRALGVRLALDDFGTGYSSLAHLRQFTVDVLKIDRSFVSGIAEGEPLPAIVRGTIDLGRTLGLKVLAEGVEHEHQARLLADCCCDTAQGYLFAKPLERTDAEALLLEQAAVRRPQVPAPRSRVGQAVRPA